MRKYMNQLNRIKNSDIQNIRITNPNGRRLRILTLLALLFTAGGGSMTYAQSPQFSIFESLEARQKSGEGIIVIHQPDAIKRLVGTRIDSGKLNILNGKTYITTRGYRIQVYSGNNQKTSRGEASALQERIKGLFPNMESDTRFDAPFWRLHVGHFLTFEEASIMKRELLNVFPQKKNEIIIFEDDIRVLLD